MNDRNRNNQKRDEMKTLMTQVLGPKGWTKAEVAAELGVSTGTVGVWARGDSMGLNSQRAWLAKLKAKTNAHHPKTTKSPHAPAKALPVDLGTLRARYFASLPVRLTCPHCERSRHKKLFGLRYMGTNTAGEPVIRRQSRCNSCR
jgi:hypothetical protein